MKILFITSYYSALQVSIQDDRWRPTGMPAIVKLFEGLSDNNILFDIIFVNRNQKQQSILKINNSRFNNFMYLINLKVRLNLKWLRQIGNVINSIILYKKTKEVLKKENYDLIYVDRSNLVVGAMLAHKGYKVILRLHGVANYYENFSNTLFKVLNPITFLSMKAPFKEIICSEDGSPGRQFLKQFSRSGGVTILNGVDKTTQNKDCKVNRDVLGIKRNETVFLFLNRLSADKGIFDFLHAVCKLKEKGLEFFALIVGDGECYTEIKQRINKSKLKNVLLIGAIEHSEIYDYYKLSDVYVSLNKIGNLSNTVLEAINAEIGVITLKKSIKPLKDHSTETFFKNRAIFIDRNNVDDELTTTMSRLINNPSAIENAKMGIKECKLKLNTWEDRINREIEIIRKIAQTNNNKRYSRC